MFLPPQKEKPPPPDDDEIIAQLRKMNASRKLALSAPENSETWRKHDHAFQVCQVWFREHHIPVYFHPPTNRWRLGTRAG